MPASFPPQVLAAAESAAQRAAQRTCRPHRHALRHARSGELDRPRSGICHRSCRAADLLLHYAIADVAWFVADGDAIDSEAWQRGTTTYLPDGKAGLYPPVLCEHAASLLPDGPRPAVVFTVRVAPDGAVKLDGAERALIRSRAKLAYDSVQRCRSARQVSPNCPAALPQPKTQRGAARVDPPEQEVASDGVNAAGARHFTLSLRPQLLSERRNAALSLATNMAVADALLAAGTGLFRVMAPPDARAEARLRLTARAFELDWPKRHAAGRIRAQPRSRRPAPRRLHAGGAPRRAMAQAMCPTAPA